MQLRTKCWKSGVGLDGVYGNVFGVFVVGRSGLSEFILGVSASGCTCFTGLRLLGVACGSAVVVGSGV